MPLSVLDLSPVPTGTRPSEALHETLELARTAEAAGYHRYWLAEHHNIRSVVSTSPEVMIAGAARGIVSLIASPASSFWRSATTYRAISSRQ